MAVREIVQRGHSALSAKSKKVEIIDQDILSLVEDLKDTLHSTDNGIGLAAPQLGVNKRVIVIDMRDDKGPIVLINPRIARRGGKQKTEEACLSYPGYYGFVERPARVHVKGLNENGEQTEYIARDLLCTAFCHEIDHLDGIMYCDIAYELYKEEEKEEK
jgi:peptide deformylase